MNRSELLSSVKARFHTFVLNGDSDDLGAYVDNALGTYQDLAGHVETIFVGDTAKVGGLSQISVPSDFLARVAVKDANSRFVPSTYDRSKKALVLSGSYRLPLTLQYFVKLRGIGDDYEIPAEIVGPLQDYLEVLLAISNNERRRQVFLAGGLDVSDIPTEDVSYGRKVDMEQKMKSQRSALPMVTI